MRNFFLIAPKTTPAPTQTYSIYTHCDTRRCFSSVTFDDSIIHLATKENSHRAGSFEEAPTRVTRGQIYNVFISFSSLGLAGTPANENIVSFSFFLPCIKSNRSSVYLAPLCRVLLQNTRGPTPSLRLHAICFWVGGCGCVGHVYSREWPSGWECSRGSRVQARMPHRGSE